jgi:hypothetical protein
VRDSAASPRPTPLSIAPPPPLPPWSLFSPAGTVGAPALAASSAGDPPLPPQGAYASPRSTSRSHSRRLVPDAATVGSPSEYAYEDADSGFADAAGLRHGQYDDDGGVEEAPRRRPKPVHETVAEAARATAAAQRAVRETRGARSARRRPRRRLSAVRGGDGSPGVVDSGGDGDVSDGGPAARGSPSRAGLTVAIPGPAAVTAGGVVVSSESVQPFHSTPRRVDLLRSDWHGGQVADAYGGGEVVDLDLDAAGGGRVRWVGGGAATPRTARRPMVDLGVVTDTGAVGQPVSAARTLMRRGVHGAPAPPPPDEWTC